MHITILNSITAFKKRLTDLLRIKIVYLIYIIVCFACSIGIALYFVGKLSIATSMSYLVVFIVTFILFFITRKIIRFEYLPIIPLFLVVSLLAFFLVISNYWALGKFENIDINIFISIWFLSLILVITTPSLFYKWYSYYIKKNNQPQSHTSKEFNQLEKYLYKQLVKNKPKEGYVIELSGRWGVGKTFFWNTFVNRYFLSHEHVYISLFGKSSIREIKQDIITNLLIDTRFLNALSLKWLNLDATSFAFNIIKNKLKKTIICFDDLERISTSFSLREVLGIISELKERYHCKVIIINNKEKLEELDKINYKTFLTKISTSSSNNDLKEIYYLSQTNNAKIYNDFIEKIADDKLTYEPHVDDNFNLIYNSKDEYKALEYDWKIAKRHLSYVQNKDYKFNLRLIKLLFRQLRYLDSLIETTDCKEESPECKDEICKSIKSGILFLLIEEIFFNDSKENNSNEGEEGKLQKMQEKVTRLDNLKAKNYRINYSNSLNPYIKKLVSSTIIDEAKFKKALCVLNEEVEEQNRLKDISNKATEFYREFLHDFSKSDKSFVDGLSQYLRNCETKSEIIPAIGIATFDLYIDRFKKISPKNGEEYKEFKEKTLEAYLDSIANSYPQWNSFEREELDSYLDEELKEYLKEKIDEKHDMDINTSTIIEKIEKMRKGSWGPADEQQLNKISVSQQKEWMVSDSTYVEKSFNFILWLKGFSGDRPAANFYSTFIEALEELSRSKEHKSIWVKTDIMLKYLKNKES